MSGELELRLRDRLAKLKRLRLPGAGVSDEVRRIEQQLEAMEAGEERDEEEIWRSVELARHPERPYTLDYIERLIGDWVELHGDRARMDDPAVLAGLGSFTGRTVAVIGHQKGRGDAVQRVKRNFGMSNPEGYRKAMRVMKIAERHSFPVITFVDTPGAYPGVAAEQHGQGGALAASQAAMARLSVPTVACIIGEGGSGGAIAFALANRVLMQQYAIYSVISPEGCASILWRDAGQARKAAAAFRPDAAHCLELGAVDVVVPEPENGAHTDYDEAARLLGRSIRSALEELERIDGQQLRRARRERFRSLGIVAS
jgi:acetyl-CoA carboxylase carboxyl transferase subunit alpha